MPFLELYAVTECTCTYTCTILQIYSELPGTFLVGIGIFPKILLQQNSFQEQQHDPSIYFLLQICATVAAGRQLVAGACFLALF